MKVHFIALIISISIPVTGQNLVPNPSFENLNYCPFDRGQINAAIPWETASSGTPDLYNSCSNGQYLKVPFAGRWIDSYQNPKSGKGYAAIELYTNGNLSSGNSEYMEVKLLSALKNSTNYFIEFYIAPDITQIGFFGYTDAVGLAFSESFYYKTIGPMEALPLTPAIENRGKLITDTADWTRISGCYTAKGGENYAIIGNFRSTQETIVEFVNPTYPFNSYFYVDDVLIQAFDPLPDTLLLCDGQSKSYNAAFLDANYQWNTGSKDSVLTIQSEGIYSVEATLGQCTLRDTIHVLGTHEKGSFPKDTVICEDEPLILSAPLMGEYAWSDGSKNKDLNVSASGVYELNVKNECGLFFFSTNVTANDCACNIYVPNAFSPNSEGVNNILEVFFGCDFEYKMLNFNIFDRWGNLVYSASNNEAIKWDGLYKNKLVPNGAYTWFLEYEVIRNGLAQKLLKRGDVTVVN